MIKNKKPNVLDYLNLRQPESAPTFFQYVYIPMQYNLEETIRRWIKDNLKGRFYVGRGLFNDKNGSLSERLQIGFEDPKELSYFTLACPHLKY